MLKINSGRNFTCSVIISAMLASSVFVASSNSGHKLLNMTTGDSLYANAQPRTAAANATTNSTTNAATNIASTNQTHQSITNTQTHRFVFPQKLHFSHDLTVTINSGNPPSIANFNLSKGYKIEPVLWNLNLPSSVAFDDKRNMYIAEAGYAPGELETTPRILKVNQNGTISSFVDRILFGPITDIKYHLGMLYVANRGKISSVDVQNGHVDDRIMALPSLGNHPVGQIAIGPSDGRLYFGIGSATNSGVVGPDNYEWLKLLPSFHDVAALNIRLAGQNFNSSNVLDPVHPGSSTNTTGAFSSFGNRTQPGEMVKGDVRCNGCIISTKPDGTDPKLVAWGVNSPYGLSFDKDGKHLLVVDAGAEESGIRPIANDSDKILSIDTSSPNDLGKWYGWPDYFGNAEPVTNPKFKSSSSNQPLHFLMLNHPSLNKPTALISGTNGVSEAAFSNSSIFGAGKTFIAELGKFMPTNLDNLKKSSSTKPPSQLQMQQRGQAINGTNIVGQKIIIYNSNTAALNTTKAENKKVNFTNFLSLKKPDPTFRPIGISFNPDHTALYIVSIGKEEIRNTLPNGYPLPHPTPWFYQHTGVVWKVTNTSATVGLAATQPAKKLHLSTELAQTINSSPPPRTDYYNLLKGYKMVPALWNLDLPGSFAFDNKGNMYVASVGITYGMVTTNPSIIKIDRNGTVSLFVDRFLHGTLADIEFNKNNGLLYVSHRALISTVNLTSGLVKDIVTALPMVDYGTHPMGQLGISPDGRIYFGVGGVSNTAVPDVSDFGIGWIRDMPQMHEIPGQNIKLTGQNFESSNFLDGPNRGTNDKVITGGFSTFGTPIRAGQVVKGTVKCTSCILSVKPDGSDLRLHAWGIRNPYGLVIDNKGRLFSDTNGDDDKGIRRVTNDPDTIMELDTHKPGIVFFGWPDFPGYGEPINETIFNQSPVQNYTNEPLIQNPPPVTKPLVSLGMSVAATQAAISSNSSFGYNGLMFIGEFGTIAPVTHTFHIPNGMNPGTLMGQIRGQNVVIFDPQSRNVLNFITLNTPVGEWRPVGLQFTPDGSALYIASIEKEEIRSVTPTGVPLPHPTDWPYLKTGIIWKVEHVGPNSANSSSTIMARGQPTSLVG
jgi:glucose/arabinose dehydrogenase